ncbi:MAG: hypothetical protein WC712_14360 [Candidatus Brocadiia bacterium]
MLLHYIDNMDAKVESLRATIAEDMAEGEEAFTRNQSPMLKRRVYRLSFKPLPEGYNPFAAPTVDEKAEKAAGKKPKEVKPDDSEATLFPRPPHREGE